MRRSWFKYLFIYLALTISCLVSNAQKTKIFFSPGYGSYQMSDLKELHQDIISQVPLDLKIIDDFPSNWNFEGGMSFPLFEGKHNTGFFFNYQSTGSRSGIMDYSGYYKVDMLVKSTGIGGFYGIMLKNFKWFETHLKAKINYQMTKLDVIEDVKINTFINNNKIEMKGDGLEFGADFQIEKNFGWFSLFTSGGYSLNLNGALHLKDDKESKLLLDGNTVGADWSGWRLKLGASVNF